MGRDRKRWAGIVSGGQVQKAVDRERKQRQEKIATKRVRKRQAGISSGKHE